jgi:subtilisin family serine protease
VEEDPIRVPMAETTPWGVEAVNAPEVWNDASIPTQGDGAIVCVIDGGLYWQHEDFQGLNIVNQNNASEW